jgi:hypothetical protein
MHRGDAKSCQEAHQLNVGNHPSLSLRGRCSSLLNEAIENSVSPYRSAGFYRRNLHLLVLPQAHEGLERNYSLRREHLPCPQLSTSEGFFCQLATPGAEHLRSCAPMTSRRWRGVTFCWPALLGRPHRLAGHADKGLNFSLHSDRLGGEAPMLQGIVSLGSPATGPVHPTNLTAPNGRCSTL